jgi:hypothetical protein
MGFFSGLLIYMATAMLFSGGEPSTGFVFIVLFVGWAVSVALLLRGAKQLFQRSSRADSCWALRSGLR